MTTRLPRYRYLVDIAILTAVVLGLGAAANVIYRPKTLEPALAYVGSVQMLQIVVVWLLMRLRGETLADIGLRGPKSWPLTIITAILIAVVMFLGIYFSEKLGFHRDLSRFKLLQGNLKLTLETVIYVLIGAGFYEEFMFRGFLMQGLAMFFGGSRSAWDAALVIQGVVFGATHFYQNAVGVLITGTLGMLFGIMVMVFGRNLWIAIIAHGLLDASHSILFYFKGALTG
jgi:uncharacterized protein